MALTVAGHNDAQRKLVAKLTRMKEQRQEICLQYLQFRLGADTQLKKKMVRCLVLSVLFTLSLSDPFRWVFPFRAHLSIGVCCRCDEHDERMQLTHADCF